MAGEIRQQVEYYLSAVNLPKDVYLRSLMDPSGWIPLDAVVEFPRMQQLRATVELAAGALRSSERVEVSEDGSCVRARGTALRRACGEAPRGSAQAAGASRRLGLLADMGLPAPAADISPPRQANAQVVMLELSDEEGLRVLVQLRSMRMPCMPGHLGAIGGCRDRTDPDSRYTAVREVVEETGLSAGIMYPPVKFAEGAKADWFAMQLQSPKFKGKQDLYEVDDIHKVLPKLPPSTRPVAECFGHAWVRTCELDSIDPAMPLMGGMLWRIQQAVAHLGLHSAPPGAGLGPGAAAAAGGAAGEVIEISSDSGGEG